MASPVPSANCHKLTLHLAVPSAWKPLLTSVPKGETSERAQTLERHQRTAALGYVSSWLGLLSEMQRGHEGTFSQIHNPAFFLGHFISNSKEFFISNSTFPFLLQVLPLCLWWIQSIIHFNGNSVRGLSELNKEPQLIGYSWKFLWTLLLLSCCRTR